MVLDLEKLNKILPRCLSNFRGERKSAVRQVASMLLSAVEKGQFKACDFQIGTSRPIPTQQNIEDILARETAHLRGQIETQKRTIARLEKLSSGVDVPKYEQRIERLEHENEELKKIVAAKKPSPKPAQKKKPERRPHEAQNELLGEYVDLLDPTPMSPQELEQHAKRIWGDKWNKECAHLFQIRDMNNWIVTATGRVHSHNKEGVPARFKILRRLNAARAAKAARKLQEILDDPVTP